MKTIITIIAILLTTIAQANTWRVNNNPTNIGTPACDHCFDDLQNAINSSSVAPGDTIHVEGSTDDYGAITIAKPLVIIGTGYLLTENLGEQASSLTSKVRGIDFLSGSNGSTIEGLESIIWNDPLTFVDGLSDITVTRSYFVGSILFASNSLSDINIHSNYILGSVGNNWNSNGTILNVNIHNNYIENNLALYNSTTGICTHNVIGGDIIIQSGISDFYNNICTSTSFSFTESNNTASNVYHNIFVAGAPSPNFLDGGNNFFGLGLSVIFPSDGNTEDQITTLPFCTECQSGYVAGGPNEALMGVFGGIQPYKRGGIPSIVSVTSLDGTNATYINGTVTVVISAKSNQ